MESQRPAASLEETIEAPPELSGVQHPRRVALVAASTPHLSVETQQVLRGRLRVVAVLFTVGFLAFLLWVLFGTTPVPAQHEGFLLWMHAGLTALLGLMSLGLCRKCEMSLTKLRVAEALLFGAPAVFFVLLDYHRLQFCCALGQTPHVPQTASHWIMLILTYALFVPTTWQRALWVLAPLAAAPLAVMSALWYTSPEFSALLVQQPFVEHLVVEPLMMAVSLMIATVGVHTINTLRREAFEAKLLGHYRLGKLIGSGGMGEVYMAEHLMMKRPCAIKLIRPEKAGDPRALTRFEREVRLTARLSHYNSIDIYDYGSTEDGTFYYVMEYLPGHNVGEMVDRHGPLPPARVVHLMTQVCGALAEAHDIGLVHRDLKPANIFSAYRGGVFDVAKLLDYGLAKPTAESQDVTLTQEGAITGSPLYMSPEQATGGEVDWRSDIYSLGAVMYFMLTGQPPFTDDKPLKIMVAHASQPVVPPREIHPAVPSELEDIVLRCLEKDPDDRFQDVSALCAALSSANLHDHWSSAAAADWWENYGCPERKRMAAEALAAAG